MRINRDTMKSDEKATFELRGLYQEYGYSQFKAGKFEEYELYVRNKDFIAADSIITFSDVNGKLMALKPDLTLSIVKNYRRVPGYVEKVYYSENIYRASKSSRSYREILQTGLECMGDIDLYNLCEVTVLAARSLAAISSDYVLEISHMGLIEAVLASSEEEAKEKIVKSLSEKNLHDLRRLCREYGVREETAEALELLVTTYGDYETVLEKIRAMKPGGEARAALTELETVCGALAKEGLAAQVNVDFSIVNDMSYYSGILYKGFIKGVPSSVLSGGQYDRLMERMGKQGGAIGFAVYLDALDRLDADKRAYDFDTVLLYDEETDAAEVLKAAAEIRKTGEKVLVERAVPKKLTCRRRMKIERGEVRTLE